VDLDPGVGVVFEPDACDLGEPCRCVAVDEAMNDEIAPPNGIVRLDEAAPAAGCPPLCGDNVGVSGTLKSGGAEVKPLGPVVVAGGTCSPPACVVGWTEQAASITVDATAATAANGDLMVRIVLSPVIWVVRDRGARIDLLIPHAPPMIANRDG
jgi:hypothetical protein